jgi:hypothetical protein
VLEQQFSGVLEWTVTCAGVVGATYTLRCDAAAAFGERHRDNRGDTIIEPGYLTTEARLDLIDQLRRALERDLAPVIRERLAKHLAGIAEARDRSEEEKAAMYWLGLAQ